MLTELKRCNSIGSIDGLLFLISVLFGKSEVSRLEINNRCARENGISVNCPGAIAFLQYLKLVRVTDKSVIPTDFINQLSLKSRKDIINGIVEQTLTELINEGIFDQDTLVFDAEKGHLSIKKSAFPLDYAAIRNFLIMAGAFEKESYGEICVASYYESTFAGELKERRKKITLEQLRKKQEEQSEQGLKAEEFVLGLERGRIPGKASSIKRISDFDVAAGYDIVSYASESSVKYDRFVEVKSYLGHPHFYWSENECDTAKQKGDKYFLCLVDYIRIEEPGYQPQYIQDPYNVIFSENSWLVTSSSYRIQWISEKQGSEIKPLPCTV